MINVVDDEVNEQSRTVSPGRLLRDARESKVMSQHDVAVSLRLGVETIDALEKDDFERLPEQIFVRGYVRSYAGLVGLPAEKLVEAFNRRMGVERVPQLVSNHQAPQQIGSGDRRIRYVTYLIIALLLVLVVAWWRGESPFWKPSETMEPPSASSIAETPPTDADTGVPAGGADVAEPSRSAQEMNNVTSVSAEPSAPAQPMASPETADQTGIEAETQTVAPAPQEPATVEAQQGAAPLASRDNAASPQHESRTPPVAEDVLGLRFAEDSWLEVRDATGKRLMYRMARGGDAYTVTGKAPFRVLLGNSTAAQVEINGKPFDQSKYNKDNVARFSVGQ